MIRTILIAALTAALAACGNMAIGPVDHGCPNNPAASSGSGCEVPP